MVRYGAFGKPMDAKTRSKVSSREALTIARIVKVNHAGEYGAIRIYSAQIAVASLFYPEAVSALAEMLAHEKKHCAKFSAAMPARNARPCRMMSLWSWGGWALGFLTSLIGKRGVWTCTAAVEAAVHRHLEDQLNFLSGRDAELGDIIASIQEEELSHLHHAESQIETGDFRGGFLYRIISIATDAVIWLSTWGDSTKMARDLQSLRASR